MTKKKMFYNIGTCPLLIIVAVEANTNSTLVIETVEHTTKNGKDGQRYENYLLCFMRLQIGDSQVILKGRQGWAHIYEKQEPIL